MKRIEFCLLLLCLGLFAATLGCSEPPPPPVNVDQNAKAKVDAFKQLADAMAKDPNGMDVRAALEGVRVIAFDVRKSPKEAQEIVEIYQQRIKGKYKGDLAQEAASEGAAIEKALKEIK